MSLATRCPHCSTLFKVSLGQLQLYEGEVRCGQCQKVFSGVDHLTSADSDAWESLKLAEADVRVAQTPSANAPNGQSPAFLGQKSKKPKLKLPPWSTAPKNSRYALLGLAVLMGMQLVWWQKSSIVGQISPIARQISESSPSVQWVFAQLASGSIEVQGSGLSRNSDNQLQLDITLTNKSALPSHWPQLRVDLTDTQGLVLASRLLKPSEYLVRSDTPQSGLGPLRAGQTVEILAYLNVQQLNARLPGVNASGFKVQLFDKAPAKLTQ
ncbi:MAG: zinc-ribbon and DUF3426 domain-containing protein [Limnobacter sp.]|nr:zinc-ribbon and DUF3426 domain-containing protein [Limnobacter sp.]